MNGPALIIVVPLFTVFCVSIIGLIKPKLCFPIFLSGLATLFVLTLELLIQVINKGALKYSMGGWDPPMGIEFVVDRLSAFVLCIIAVVALITAVHSIPIVKRDLHQRSSVFYSLYLLLVTGLLGMTSTGDLFNLYVMIEIVALSTYALVALAGGRANISSLNYIMAGTVGAGLYLLGVGLLYMKTGTLNMAQMKSLLPQVYDTPTVIFGFCLILTGLFVKMALFPLHGWIANAYTFAPGPVTCLIGPLTTKVSIYVMIRIMFWVFTPEFNFQILNISELLVWLSVIAIFGGGLFALAQIEVKRMLIYVIVAEVGYMVGGVWLSNQNGLAGATYHILNDALAALCLFMAVATVRFQVRGKWIRNYQDLFKKMPFTMLAFTTGALSMIGIPPTGGFFSKWYLILGGVEAGAWHFVLALLFASLVNIVLFLRIIESGFIKGDQDSPTTLRAPLGLEKAPRAMLFPMLTISLSLIAIGLSSNVIIQHIILPVLPL